MCEIYKYVTKNFTSNEYCNVDVALHGSCYLKRQISTAPSVAKGSDSSQQEWSKMIPSD